MKPKTFDKSAKSPSGDLGVKPDSHECTNCKTVNTFSRKPSKPVSENIAGYCRNCGHVVWF
jgi:hypothetical protein